MRGALQGIVALVVVGTILVGASGVSLAQSGLSDDRFEPNDSQSEATLIDDGYYEDLTVTNGEYDYYAVDLEAGQELTAHIEFEHDAGDLDLRIYDSDGSLVTESASYNDEETATVTAGQSGTYYVSIYEYNGGSNEYDMALSSRYEPNDDESEAASLRPGTYENLAVVGGEYDYYAVDLEAGQELTAHIEFEHEVGDLDLRIYDSDGSLIAESASYNDEETATVTAGQRGTYYVSIYEYNGGSNEYGLNMQAHDTSTPTPTATPTPTPTATSSSTLTATTSQGVSATPTQSSATTSRASDEQATSGGSGADGVDEDNTSDGVDTESIPLIPIAIVVGAALVALAIRRTK